MSTQMFINTKLQESSNDDIDEIKADVESIKIDQDTLENIWEEQQKTNKILKKIYS